MSTLTKFYNYFILIISIVFFVSSPLSIKACSCGEFPSFCESAVQYNVFLGKIISQEIGPSTIGSLDAYFTNLEIIDRIGTTGLPDTISMINQDGFNCNANIFGMSVGDSVVVSIRNLSNSVEFNENYTNIPPYLKYDLLGCGDYYLAVQEGKVGQVSQNQEVVLLDDFLQNPVNNCPFVTTTSNLLKDAVLIYPNPVSNNLFIKNTGSRDLIYTLYDSSGKQLLEQASAYAKQTEQMPLSDIPSGVYLLKLSDGTLSHQEFIIKQ